MINLKSIRELQTNTKKEVAIIDYIMANMSNLNNIGIDDIAKNASVGYSTIYAFMKKLGYKSFNMFLAEIIHHRENDNTGAEYDLGNEYATIIKRTQAQIQHAEIDAVITKLNQAHNIYLFGVGKSHWVSQKFTSDLYLHNYKALCLPANDLHNVAMICTKMGPGDLLIVFSASGRTKAVIENMKLAHDSQGEVILFTYNGDSPATKLCDLAPTMIDFENFYQVHYINRNLPFLFITDYICDKIISNT